MFNMWKKNEIVSLTPSKHVVSPDGKWCIEYYPDQDGLRVYSLFKLIPLTKPEEKLSDVSRKGVLMDQIKLLDKDWILEWADMESVQSYPVSSEASEVAITWSETPPATLHLLDLKSNLFKEIEISAKNKSFEPDLKFYVPFPVADQNDNEDNDDNHIV